jgi:DNA-binding XRE family transcriptional regulator
LGANPVTFLEIAMSVQVISRDGEPEYAVLPWKEYKELVNAREQHLRQEAQALKSALPRIDQLQALREARGLAADQLARAVGISPAYLALIEKGERQPDTAIRRALALALEQTGWGDDE